MVAVTTAIVFLECVYNAGANHASKCDRDCISYLAHTLGPRIWEMIPIWKRLESCALPHREVSHGPVGVGQHVLAPRNPMVASLQGLCWNVQDAAGMSRITPRTRLKSVVRNSSRFRRLRIRQTRQSIANRPPTSGKWKRRNPFKSVVHPRRCRRTLSARNLVLVPIGSVNPLRGVERIARVS